MKTFSLRPSGVGSGFMPPPFFFEVAVMTLNGKMESGMV